MPASAVEGVPEVQFADIPIADAEGAILAHTLALPSGTLKKGRVLTAADVETLRAAGRERIVAARLEAGDVAEDVAARRLAEALAGQGVRVAAPFTGRANLFAVTHGVLRLDADALGAVNAIDESLTIATLAPNERVAAGQMIATVKVIPFAVRQSALTAALARAETAVLDVHPFQPHVAGLILTRLPQTKDSVLAKRAEVVATRLAALGATSTPADVVDHGPETVAKAIRRLVEQSAAPILVFSASAIVDRGDVVPAGLVAAGGVIERLGMPVDPGNLLLLGRIGTTPVVGIPSCAASPKLNGFDWVLERLLAGLPVTSRDIARMGVGGLLNEIPTRPQPREGHGPSPRRAPRIEAIVLAAGRSTRMGTNKLLEVLGDRPIVRYVVDAARAAQTIDRIVVVTGHQADAVGAALADTPAAITHNPDFALGLSTSLRTGLAALSSDADGAVILLGDMPQIAAADLDRLVAAFAPADGRSIVVPTREGRHGNPVLWGRAHFADMAAITGDTGAKALLAANTDTVAEVGLETDAIFTDVDTPDALAALRMARGGG
jgi:molybdenum cofactor cytidylyltransferase